MIRGLVGIVSTDGTPIDPGLIDAMLRTMGARADHRHAEYRSSTAALAVGGPVVGDWSTEGRSSPAQVVADLRLDNRASLARRLECSDRDDAVLHHAYAEWGERCVEHIHGDFALAVWDPAAQTLCLARDRFGVRPLVYTSGPGWFAFASEVKALLALSGVPLESSELRIAEFLAGRPPPADATNFKSIHRLPAGHRLTVGSGGTQIQRYFGWELPPLTRVPDLSSAMAEAFSRAVARRSGGKKPTAVLLSGGLDSSSIAVTLKDQRRDLDGAIDTYSIVFDKYPEQSERAYIEAVLDTGSFKPHFLSLDVEDPFESFAELLARQDGLFLTPGLGMGRDLLAQLARGTVVIDGHGGDEVVSDGYERLHELAQRRHWFRFWIEAVGASRITSSSPLSISAGYYAQYGRGGWRMMPLLKWLAGPSARQDRRSNTLVSERLQARLAPLEPSVPESGAQDGRWRHMALLSDPGQQHVLEVLDRDAVGRGLEVRFPFWDEDLIAFMLSVPAAEKLKGGWTRRILRDAMKGKLPDVIRWRRDKHDFNDHLVRGLLTSSATSAHRFDRAGPRLANYMDLSLVQAARERLSMNDRGATGQDVHTLWRATAVAEWLDYADSNGIRIVE